jgi:hypothetical protein
MPDTSGFYKLDGETLLHAPNAVYNRDYMLSRASPPADPVDGWQWFDDREAACAAYAYVERPAPTEDDAQ